MQYVFYFYFLLLNFSLPLVSNDVCCTIYIHAFSVCKLQPFSQPHSLYVLAAFLVIRLLFLSFP